MRSIVNRFSVVAALALTAAIPGQSAERTQKVDVNFGFRTPAGQHAPGQYTVEVRNSTGGSQFIFLTSAATRKSVLFYTQAPMQKMRSDDPPRLVFKCATAGCDLAEVWSDGLNGFTIARNKKAPAVDEANTVAVAVPLATRAD